MSYDFLLVATGWSKTTCSHPTCRLIADDFFFDARLRELESKGTFHECELQKNLFQISTSHLLELCRKVFF